MHCMQKNWQMMGILGCRCCIPGILLMAALGLSGCNGRGQNAPPFDLGSPVEGKVVEPRVELLEPTGKLRVQWQKMLTCRVRLTILDGGTLPASLACELFSEKQSPANRPTSFATFAPVSFDQNQYLLQAKVRAPSVTGAYRLRIEAFYAVKRPATLNVRGEDQYDEVKFHLDGPLIEVVR